MSFLIWVSIRRVLVIGFEKKYKERRSVSVDVLCWSLKNKGWWFWFWFQSKERSFGYLINELEKNCVKERKISMNWKKIRSLAFLIFIRRAYGWFNRRVFGFVRRDFKDSYKELFVTLNEGVKNLGYFKFEGVILEIRTKNITVH